MTDQTTFSKLDADWILKRAAEIEGSEDTRPITVGELQSIAREAGFGMHAIERAIAEAKRAASSEDRRPPVQRTGFLRYHLWTTRSVPVEISSDELMKAVRLFQPYREGAAQIKLEEDRITWRDRKDIRFTVNSSGGVTTIRAFVSKFGLRRRRWKEWVAAAADRLETLVFIIATYDRPASGLLAPLPESDDPDDLN